MAFKLKLDCKFEENGGYFSRIVRGNFAHRPVFKEICGKKCRKVPSNRNFSDQ